MPNANRCKNLVETYPGKTPVEAVRGIDFEVNVGECYGVLDPNGAGKTTTIEIWEGLLKATTGEAEDLGMRWDQNAVAIRERIGVSLQETQLSDRNVTKCISVLIYLPDRVHCRRACLCHMANFSTGFGIAD